MIEVTLQTEPEGEINILGVSGDTFEACAELFHNLSNYLRNTMFNSGTEQETEHYVRVNRRMMIVVGYLNRLLQHGLNPWRVILLRADGVEFCRIDYTLAGEERARVEEPSISRPTRFEHEPVI